MNQKIATKIGQAYQARTGQSYGEFLAENLYRNNPVRHSPLGKQYIRDIYRAYNLVNYSYEDAMNCLACDELGVYDDDSLDDLQGFYEWQQCIEREWNKAHWIKVTARG